jgi:hypothetical protein
MISSKTSIAARSLSKRLVRALDHWRDKTIGCHSSPDPGQPFFNLIICRARLSLSPD